MSFKNASAMLIFYCFLTKAIVLSYSGYVGIGESKGIPFDPISSFSYNFRQKSCQIIDFCPTLRGCCLRPPTVLEVLDPPLVGIDPQDTYRTFFRYVVRNQKIIEDFVRELQPLWLLPNASVRFLGDMSP